MAAQFVGACCTRAEIPEEFAKQWYVVLGGQLLSGLINVTYNVLSIAAFSLVGVAADGALVLSLLFGLLVVVTSLPGGVVWLLSGDRNMDMNVAAIEADTVPAPTGENRE